MLFIALLLMCACAVHSQYGPQLNQESLGRYSFGQSSSGQSSLGHGSLGQYSFGGAPSGQYSLGQGSLDHGLLGQDSLSQGSLGQGSLSSLNKGSLSSLNQGSLGQGALGQYSLDQGVSGLDSLSQSSLSHDSLGQNSFDQGSLGQGSLGQNALGQGSLGQSSLSIVPLGQDALGQDSLGQGSLSRDSLSQDSLGQGSLGQSSSGQDSLGQGALSPTMSIGHLSSQEQSLQTMGHNNVDTNAQLGMPNPLYPSKYRIALDNFELLAQEIWYHTQHPRKNFLTIAGLLVGMSNVMAELPWKEYDSVYGDFAPALLEVSRDYPQMVVQELDCILTQHTLGIQQLVSVMNSYYVKQICDQRPDLCDQVISTVVDSAPHLKRQAHELLLLGSYAKTFVEYFVEFKKAETYDDYGLLVWMVRSKNKLKPLIGVGSQLQSTFPHECEAMAELVGSAASNIRNLQQRYGLTTHVRGGHPTHRRIYNVVTRN